MIDRLRMPRIDSSLLRADLVARRLLPAFALLFVFAGAAEARNSLEAGSKVHNAERVLACAFTDSQRCSISCAVPEGTAALVYDGVRRAIVAELAGGHALIELQRGSAADNLSLLVGNVSGCSFSNLRDVALGGGGSTSPPSEEPAPTPEISLSVSPASVEAGGRAIVTWSTRHVSSCTAGGAWSGNKAASGSEEVGPLSGDSSFSLTCGGATSSATASDTVEVQVIAKPSASGSKGGGGAISLGLLLGLITLLLLGVVSACRNELERTATRGRCVQLRWAALYGRAGLRRAFVRSDASPRDRTSAS